MTEILLVTSVLFAIYICCSIVFSCDSESITTGTINKNGEDFRLTVWDKQGPILSRRGWSRSVDRGDGWRVLEEGLGQCPYSLRDQEWAGDKNF